MSAIWGIIDFSQSNISEKEQSKMKAPFDQCRIDRFDQQIHKNIYMGCGIQYFTKEAEYECLPIMEVEQGYCFNADVILDNREELCEKLKRKEETSLPDGTILCEIFHQYGEDCLNELLGAYAFVYYDSKKHRASLAIDATGNRFIYYHIHGDKLYYSTLMEPLILVKEQADMNERWLSDFLALENPMTITELEETPIEGIYRVAPGQIVTVDQNGIKKHSYWEPLTNFKELKLPNDEAYAKQFRSIFDKAVSCMLRSRGETGILLSGGLDSTAVACMAAPMLEKKDKTLYSFTSVPIEEYQSNLPSNKITNEKEIVEKTKEYLVNMNCSFIDMPMVNAWDSRKDKMRYCEFPYKSVMNIHWIWEALHQASQKNIRIMLNGMCGNCTISFADPRLYLNTLLSHGRFIKMWSELRAFKGTRQISRKQILKMTLRDYLFHKPSLVENVLDRSYIQKQMYDQYKVEERLSNMYGKIEKAMKDFAKYRYLLCNKVMFRQIGEIDVKSSLYTGVLQRDPTRDKRIIEFCLQLPIDQYVKNGEERRLVNVYLSDIMPQHVINVGKIGVQGADLTFRISKYWDRIREEWLSGYRKHIDNKLVDCNKAISRIEQMTSVHDYKEFDMVRHIYSNIVLEYMDYVKELSMQQKV